MSLDARWAEIDRLRRLHDSRERIASRMMSTLIRTDPDRDWVTVAKDAVIVADVLMGTLDAVAPPWEKKP